VTRPDDDRWHFRPDVPGVYILCRLRHGGKGGKRRGDILIAPPGETFWGPSRVELSDGTLTASDISVSLADCPEHGPLDVDRNDLAAAVAKARRLGRVVSLRASPTR
jgi:hypothetical protein